MGEGPAIATRQEIAEVDDGDLEAEGDAAGVHAAEADEAFDREVAHELAEQPLALQGGVELAGGRTAAVLPEHLCREGVVLQQREHLALVAAAPGGDEDALAAGPERADQRREERDRLRGDEIEPEHELPPAAAPAGYHGCARTQPAVPLESRRDGRRLGSCRDRDTEKTFSRNQAWNREGAIGGGGWTPKE